VLCDHLQGLKIIVMSKTKCVVCKIISGDLETKFVHKSEDVFVFHDINPKAPTHLLIVPREHIKSLLDLKDKHSWLLTKMIKVVQTLVKEKKLEGGFRVLINGGSFQVVEHLHFHLLSEETLVD